MQFNHSNFNRQLGMGHGGIDNAFTFIFEEFILNNIYDTQNVEFLR